MLANILISVCISKITQNSYPPSIHLFLLIVKLVSMISGSNNGKSLSFIPFATTYFFC